MELDGKVLVMLPWDDEGRVTPEYSAMRAVLKGGTN